MEGPERRKCSFQEKVLEVRSYQAKNSITITKGESK